MAKVVKKYGKVALILALILVLVGIYWTIPTGQAASIANREMKISDSRPSQTGVTYDFEGDHSSTTVMCLKVQFCTTATGTCTFPTGMSVDSATKGDSADWSGWTYANWTFATSADGFNYTYSTGEAGGANYSFSTNNITNPSSAGTYYARVATYTNTDCSTGETDTGVAAFAIISGVSVSATIAETLSFTISDTAIGFGELDTASVRYATADETGSTTEPGAGLPTQLTLSTNASGGVTVTIHDIGNGTSAGLYDSTTTSLIAAVASSGVSAGSEGYGAYGKNASANLTIDEGFDDDGTSDLAISTSPQTFVSSSGAISSETVDLSLKAAISGTTPAGSYSDTIVFIATPVY